MAASLVKLSKVTAALAAVAGGSVYLLRNVVEAEKSQSIVSNQDTEKHSPKESMKSRQATSRQLRHDKASEVIGSHYISWNEYFMSVAELAARRSKDPVTQVGACIVNNQNRIVATGYNGMPNGVDDSLVPWSKEGPFLETKYAYVVHAELNAILNSVLTDQTGCRLYVSLFPCNECAKAIIQSGIKHVIYKSDKHKDKDSTKASKIMLGMAGVKVEQYSDIIATSKSRA